MKIYKISQFNKDKPVFYCEFGHKYDPNNPNILWMMSQNGNIYKIKQTNKDTIHGSDIFPQWNEKIARGRFEPLTNKVSIYIFKYLITQTTFTQQDIIDMVKQSFGPNTQIAYLKYANNYCSIYKISGKSSDTTDVRYMDIGHTIDFNNLLWIMTNNGNIHTKNQTLEGAIHGYDLFGHLWEDRIASGRFEKLTKRISLYVYTNLINKTSFTKDDVISFVKNKFGQDIKIVYFGRD